MRRDDETMRDRDVGDDMERVRDRIYDARALVVGIA